MNNLASNLSAFTSFIPLTKGDFAEKYEQLKDQYEYLCRILEDTIRQLLKDDGKIFLAVTSRVKDVYSVYDKIVKYKIDNPFSSIKDWCGLRIIYYYYNNVDEIGSLLEKEFDVVERKDKRAALEPSQFGYRSYGLHLPC